MERGKEGAGRAEAVAPYDKYSGAQRGLKRMYESVEAVEFSQRRDLAVKHARAALKDAAVMEASNAELRQRVKGQHEAVEFLWGLVKPFVREGEAVPSGYGGEPARYETYMDAPDLSAGAVRDWLAGQVACHYPK
jgi:hypothetical protein